MNPLQAQPLLHPARRHSAGLRLATCVDLPAGEALSLDNIDGFNLAPQSGVLWVTESVGSQDIILHAGQAHVVRHAGRVVVTALGSSARIVLTQASAEPRSSMAERLLRQALRGARSLRELLLHRPASRLIPEA